MMKWNGDVKTSHSRMSGELLYFENLKRKEKK
ncbi:MAG: hypothetical protein DDT32_01524 [Syntrophomonadaceae bacterium]|nr:hypothetical protein [Bacillota bacterium]